MQGTSAGSALFVFKMFKNTRFVADLILKITKKPQKATKNAQNRQICDFYVIKVKWKRRIEKIYMRAV